MKLMGNFVLFTASGAVLLVIGLFAVLMSLPDVTQLEKCMTTSMYQVRLCPDGAQYVRLKQISPYVIHAVIAAEDGSFYSHQGFDWHEIQASLTTNLRSGKLRRGGSTLTQQLAKNVFLDKEKSFWRKLKEAYLAYAIESKYKKDVILEKYLNVVEFGPKIFGVKAASLHYFQKSPSELNPLEGAYLAFLLPNPKTYSRTYSKGELTPFARKMVAIILKRMASFGKLSPPAYQTAMANMNGFPWRHLSFDSFSGSPSYSLEASAPSGGFDESIDEEALEEIIEESDFVDPNAASGTPESAPE
ncbi:MAG TPA: biosynthetic peptidoglycan transglycosylase [Bdellovibrionales bacterium]|nr:biosynthetic peptidoglycan transglycosylase [Bdellovibrionales bacterium]